MLATVRRGPFAAPTQEEKIEFLLTRMKKSDCKIAFADHALEHAWGKFKLGSKIRRRRYKGNTTRKAMADLHFLLANVSKAIARLNFACCISIGFRVLQGNN